MRREFSQHNKNISVMGAKTQNAQKANLYYLQQTYPILLDYVSSAPLSKHTNVKGGLEHRTWLPPWSLRCIILNALCYAGTFTTIRVARGEQLTLHSCLAHNNIMEVSEGLARGSKTDPQINLFKVVLKIHNFPLTELIKQEEASVSNIVKFLI
eukprot:sb/3473319/